MPSLDELNRSSQENAHSALLRCCGASRWVAQMLERRPWKSQSVIYSDADEIWGGMGREDILEAFTHHPRIGADLEALRRKFATTASWSGAEQSGVSTANEEVLVALRDGNCAYEEKFGYIFIVCATGKSASEMLDILNRRLSHEPESELEIAAGEQAKITRIRLEKLLA